MTLCSKVKTMPDINQALNSVYRRETRKSKTAIITKDDIT